MCAERHVVTGIERLARYGSWFCCLVTVLGFAVTGCRKETSSTKGAGSAPSSAERRAPPAPSGSTRPPPSAPSGVPVVEERHGLGDKCSFRIFEGSAPLPLKVVKLISCEFEPKVGAPVFEFMLRSRLSGEGIESVTISTKETGWSEKFAPIEAANSGLEKEVELTDMNFDGFQDLKLLESYGTAGYGYYAIWVYQPDAKKYVLIEDLRRLANPEADSVTGSIIGEPDNPSCRGHDQFRLEGKRLVLIKRCIWTGRESTTGDWLQTDRDARKGTKTPLRAPPDQL